MIFVIWEYKFYCFSLFLVNFFMYCLIRYEVWMNIYLVLIFLFEIFVMGGYGVCWLVVER